MQDQAAVRVNHRKVGDSLHRSPSMDPVNSKFASADSIKFDDDLGAHHDVFSALIDHPQRLGSLLLFVIVQRVCENVGIDERAVSRSTFGEPLKVQFVT